MSAPTIASALREATIRIGAVSATPRLDAEVLLGQVTGKARTHFFAWPEKRLTPEESAGFGELVQRRCDGAPIAYLTGSREFWSRAFCITPDVLIPRPETELLIDLALARIPTDAPLRIADLGTGSGAIAVTLALERPLAQVTALDVSPAALDVARHNAQRLGAGNIEFHVSNWFDALPSGECFDLIVSNPPYIAAGDAHLAQGDVRFEPALALASGVDGLDAIRSIVGASRRYLQDGGWLLLEHGFAQGPAVGVLLAAQHFSEVCGHLDLQGHRRVTFGRIGTGTTAQHQAEELRAQNNTAAAMPLANSLVTSR